MKRCILILVLVALAFVALPAAAQPGPFSLGAYAGADLIPNTDWTEFLTFIPFGVSARCSVFDWLAVRADVGFSDYLNKTTWFLDASAGLEIPIVAGFYAKVTGGLWYPFRASWGNLYNVTGALGFSMAGFFIEAGGGLVFEDEDAMPLIGARAGYRFSL